MTAHETAESSSPSVAPTRIVLRPVATPLPLGFAALSIATTAFATVQLGWVPPAQESAVALGVLVLTTPLQLLAAVMGFVARDPVAATGMGVLSGTWAAVCLTTLTSPPRAPSDGLGVILLMSGVCLLVPAAGAWSKVVPALVIATSAVRFAVTGVAELDGGQGWVHAAGWVGLGLAALSLYAALALELEGTAHRTVLPLGRRGSARIPAGTAQGEPGVRSQL